MREILFRGRRVDGGGWAYGSLIAARDFCCILESEDDGSRYDFPYLNSEMGTIDGNAIPVIPETVGQYTGLTDRYGKKICEGDIVKHFNNTVEEYDIGEIYYDTDFVGWRRTTQGRFHNNTLISTYKLNPNCLYEVIGNIHYNPELLKEGAENGNTEKDN